MRLIKCHAQFSAISSVCQYPGGSLSAPFLFCSPAGLLGPLTPIITFHLSLDEPQAPLILPHFSLWQGQSYVLNAILIFLLLPLPLLPLSYNTSVLSQTTTTIEERLKKEFNDSSEIRNILNLNTPTLFLHIVNCVHKYRQHVTHVKSHVFIRTENYNSKTRRESTVRFDPGFKKADE